MDLMKSKKSFLYTIIAITLLLMITFASTAVYQYKYREQSAVAEARVSTMDNFLDDLGDDIEKGVQTASYHAIIGMTNYVVESLSYLDDSEQRFKELFALGTIYGNESFAMENNSFQDWTDKMRIEAEKIGVNVTFSIESLEVYPIDAWTLQVSTNVTVLSEDIRHIATWTRSYSISSNIPIEGFEDPFYAVETGNGVFKIINRTIFEGNYVVGNDTTNLQIHMNNTLYAGFNASPSFMMRFEGDMNGSEYGIESLVDKLEISSYHPCPNGTSNTDILYWQCSLVNAKRVANMPSSFYMDNETGDEGRYEKYEVGGLV
ncbi:MAG: hypothetical protein ACE5DM_01820 [Candidatus Nanoarchaeia archaeon]